MKAKAVEECWKCYQDLYKYVYPISAYIFSYPLCNIVTWIYVWYMSTYRTNRRLISKFQPGKEKRGYGRGSFTKGPLDTIIAKYLICMYLHLTLRYMKNLYSYIFTFHVNSIIFLFILYIFIRHTYTFPTLN